MGCDDRPAQRAFGGGGVVTAFAGVGGGVDDDHPGRRERGLGGGGEDQQECDQGEEEADHQVRDRTAAALAWHPSNGGPSSSSRVNHSVISPVWPGRTKPLS